MKTNQSIAFADLDAEKEVIALLCNFPSYTKEIQKLITTEVFHYSSTKAIYLTCIELYSEKGMFSLQDLILRLKSSNNKDWAVVMSVTTNKNPMDAHELIMYLAELKGKRDLLSLSKEINNDLINGTDYFEMVNKINKINNQELIKEDNNEILDMKSALLSAVNTIGDVMTNGQLSGVPTGYPKLDEITGGWLKGNVILFAARPGQGKTIALLEHTRWAAQMNKNVLFLSLEMPVVSLIYRMISGNLDESTPYSKIKTGRINIETFTKIQRTTMANLEKLPITWYDGANRDVNYLTNLIQKISRDKKIDMVVIDYLQLLTDNSIKSNNEIEVIGSVSKKIQQLTKKLNIPFLCAAQLNRQSEGRTSHRPKLSDLRSSGQIEQDASVVIGLYREDYYAYERAKEEGNSDFEFTNKIEYIFMKNRDGDTRTADMYIDVATSKIREFHPGFGDSNVF
jgi:replicative DNA helicase